MRVRASWTASRSWCGSGCSTTPAASSTTRRPLESARPRRPADVDRRGAGVRAFVARRRPGSVDLPLAARRARASVRQGVDRDRLEDPVRRDRHRARGGLAGAAGRLLRASTCRPPPPSGSAWCRGSRCRGSCRPGTSPARAPRSPALSLRERAEARSIVNEVRYVELSGRADFNDAFIDQLAFPDEPHRRHRLRRAGRGRAKARAQPRMVGRRASRAGAAAQPPELIPEAVAAEVDRLSDSYDRVAVAYGDCGTYGALDAVLRRRVHRLAGQHCYDLFAREEVREALEEEPGTYFLTDFLARTFEHTVIKQLGLDRHPELRDDYFGNYRRVIWLAQRPTLGTKLAAERAAAASGCRSRCARWATRAWSAPWNRCSRRRRPAAAPLGRRPTAALRGGEAGVWRASIGMRYERAEPPPDVRLAALAARQHGIVTRRQLAALGLDHSAIARRMKTGRLHQLYRNVYAVGRTDLTMRGRYLSAVLAYGNSAVLSHRSAAVLWRILPERERRIDVTCAGRHASATPRHCGPPLFSAGGAEDHRRSDPGHHAGANDCRPRRLLHPPRARKGNRRGHLPRPGPDLIAAVAGPSRQRPVGGGDPHTQRGHHPHPLRLRGARPRRLRATMDYRAHW